MSRMFSMPFSNDRIARELEDVFSVFKPSIRIRGGFATISCLLFDDQVTERLCTLRRLELHGKGEFSCFECVHHGEHSSADVASRSEQRIPDVLAR